MRGREGFEESDEKFFKEYSERLGRRMLEDESDKRALAEAEKELKALRAREDLEWTGLLEEEIDLQKAAARKALEERADSAADIAIERRLLPKPRMTALERLLAKTKHAALPFAFSAAVLGGCDPIPQSVHDAIKQEQETAQLLNEKHAILNETRFHHIDRALIDFKERINARARPTKRGIISPTILHIIVTRAEVRQAGKSGFLAEPDALATIDLKVEINDGTSRRWIEVSEQYTIETKDYPILSGESWWQVREESLDGATREALSRVEERLAASAPAPRAARAR